MRPLILTFFLFASLMGSAQKGFDTSKVSEGTLAIVEKIEKGEKLQSSAVGAGGVRPAQYEHFSDLKEEASTDELKALTDHPHPTVRSYAFWALTYRPSVKLFPILLEHFDDTATVTTQFGCIVSERKVGDFFIDLVRPRYIDPDTRKLDSNQLARLDSHLVHTPNRLDATSSALLKTAPKESSYPRVRELAKKGRPSALCALATYQKERDVELILRKAEQVKKNEEKLGRVYQAMERFPHPRFFPFLKKELESSFDKSHHDPELRSLYKAIASYRNERAAKLLESVFTEVQKKTRRYHLNYLHQSLQTHESPHFEKLLWKLWEKDRLAPEHYELLRNKDPERAYSLSKESLEQGSRFLHLNSGLAPSGASGELRSLLVRMMGQVLDKEPEVGKRIVRERIRKANVHTFPAIAKVAEEWQSPSFVDPLLKRMKNETNGHIFLEAAEALLAYDAERVDRMLLDAIDEHEHLRTGWGGKRLAKLLEEHGVE